MKSIARLVAIVCFISSTLAVSIKGSLIDVRVPVGFQPVVGSIASSPLSSDGNTGFEAPELAALLTQEESSELKHIEVLSLTRIFEIFQHMLSKQRENETSSGETFEIRFKISDTFLDGRLDSTADMDDYFDQIWFEYGDLPISHQRPESRNLVQKFKKDAILGIPSTLSKAQIGEIVQAINNINPDAPLKRK